MDIFTILDFICALALFLYGMHVMSESMRRAVGGRLEGILQRLTASGLRGVALGAFVTAVIQSSSATTVTIVGLVEAGVMRLSQAAGVIMGANIGTTVTGWLLAMAGIRSDNVFVRLLKPSSFTPVLAAVGVGLLLFSRRERRREIGSVLVGFAVMMVGMEQMSAAVKPLANAPEVSALLLRCSHPLTGLLAGLLITAIIQSSSASVGILQALCMTRAISFGAALPIIMGQNIGTCVTAMLAAVGAGINAKRAARIHLFFNLIGTTLFMLVFYALNAWFPLAFLSRPAGAAGIAVIHTAFNLLTTAALLPFAQGITRLSVLSVPEKTGKNRFLSKTMTE